MPAPAGRWFPAEQSMWECFGMGDDDCGKHAKALRSHGMPLMAGHGGLAEPTSQGGKVGRPLTSGGGERGTSEVMKTMFRFASAVTRTQIRDRRRCLDPLGMPGSVHSRALQQGTSRKVLRSRSAY